MELALTPDCLKSILRRQLIARREGDIKREKELLDMEIKLDPNNQKAIFRRRLIAKEDKDLENERKLLDMLLQTNPNKVKLLSSRIRIAREEGEIKTEKLLLERLIELEPRNEIAIKRRITIAKIESDEENKEKYKRMLKRRQNNLDVEQMMLQEDEKKKEENPQLSYVDSVRLLIYENKNVIQTSEKINELLENVDETTREILLAELYFVSNLPLRAERSLKSYKKKLEAEKDGNKDDIKLVGRAIELIKARKTRKYNWDVLWQRKEELEQENER